METYNITISGELQQDLADLHINVPGDEFYLIDKETKEVVKVEKYTIKQMFSSSIEQLKNILDEIIKKNIEIDISQCVHDEFEKVVKDYFLIELYTENLLKFKGEVEELPETAKTGNIFKKNDNFYIFYENDKYKKILTLETLEDILKNFYTKNEIDEIFEEFQTELNEFKESTINSLNDFTNILTEHTISKNEFNQKINYYSEQLQFLNTSFNKLINNWNSELNSVQIYKNNIQSELNSYSLKYQNLLDNVNNVKQQIVEININNSNLSNSISSIFKTFDNYNNIISGLFQTVNILSTQLSELSRFDQEVLN